MYECQSKLLKIIFNFFILFFFNNISYAATQPILWKQITIPMPEAGASGLEALLVWPNTPGKHPLALISHGSPRDPNARPKMSAMSFYPIAMEFARRGFTAAVVLRRGYGASGGGWAESNGTCKATTYPQAALAASKDLHAAINYLGTLPEVDTDRMIAVGVSAGGFATVALTADSPPKGLVAAISFAGGRGSKSADFICQEEALISTFSVLGKTSRTPMLWVYAKNDHFFNPAAAHQFFQAFQASGGNATFIEAPDFGSDGHLLFSTAGIPFWTPILDNYLKNQHLVLVDTLLPLPSIVSLAPPKTLSNKNKKIFFDYLKAAPHKAFAIDNKGSLGWSSGRRSVAEAKEAALTFCEQYSKASCRLYAVDNELLRN